MPIIEWNSSYSIGVQQIDLHHQYIFTLLNKTYDSFVHDGSVKNMRMLFDELIDYAVYHFYMEEQIMESHRYPDMIEHKNEHDGFSVRVVDMYKDYCNGRKAMSLELLYFLQEWLVRHIVNSDSRLGRFLVDQEKKKSINCRKRPARI